MGVPTRASRSRTVSSVPLHRVSSVTSATWRRPRDATPGPHKGLRDLRKPAPAARKQGPTPKQASDQLSLRQLSKVRKQVLQKLLKIPITQHGSSIKSVSEAGSVGDQLITRRDLYKNRPVRKAPKRPGARAEDPLASFFLTARTVRPPKPSGKRRRLLSSEVTLDELRDPG